MEFATYQIYFRLAADVIIAVGRFGIFPFPAGRYVYTGSARRNLEARIQRHQRRSKPLRWHVDYLLAAPAARITGITRGVLPECALNQATAGRLPVPGFGAGDCRSGCGSHLKYLGV